MNRLDANLQAVCPTVMATRFDALPPLSDPGHRFVVAQDGLYLETHRSWLNCRVAVGPSAIPLPYGEIREAVSIRIVGDLLREALARFIAEAQAACPREHAAWLAVNAQGEVLYLPVEVESANTGHIRYRRPDAPDGYVLAVDIHSHGRFKAFWSSTDDQDDLDDAKLAVVVGDLHKETPSLACRLVLPPGVQLDFSAWATGLL